jgi:hypothetical protein
MRVRRAESSLCDRVRAKHNDCVKRDSTPRNLGAFLPPELLKGLSVRMDETTRLAALWRRYAPVALADHVQPVSCADGCLTLQTDSAAWASRVRHSQQTLLAQLRAEPGFQNLRELRIRVRPLQADTPASPRADKPTRLSAQGARCVASAADSIEDPQLRAALKRLSDNVSGRGATTPKRGR